MQYINRIQGKISSLLNLDSDPLFKSVFKGSSVTLVARLANAFILLIINLIVARNYGSEVVGVLAVANSILNVTFIFNLFGANTAILRLVPEYKSKYSPGSAREVYYRTLRIVFGLAPFISGFIVLFGYFWLKYQDASVDIGLLFITAALSPLYSIYKINTETIRAFFHNRLYALAHVLPALTNILLLFGFIFLLPDQRGPLWAFYGSNVLIAIGTWWIVRSILPPKVIGENIVAIPYMEIVLISVPMGISMGINQMMSYLDNLILGIYRPEAEVGIYSTAVKLSVLMGFVIFSVNAASASKFSQLYYSDRKAELMSLVKKSNNFIVWASFPIFLVLIVAGKPILSMFGTEFIVGFPTLVLLVTSAFINAIGGSNGLFMNMTGSQNQQRNIMLTALAVYVGLNFLLIPLLGYNGAAWARLISTLEWNLASTIAIYRNTGHWISYLPEFIRKKIEG
jgi:O-antigen/teichoic acid export membrane protein